MANLRCDGEIGIVGRLCCALLPSDDFDSYVGRRRERREAEYVQRVSRIEHLARTYWFDLLIALVAIVAIA